ncbi:DUF2339 domain-containing protein [Methylobacterium haplocladii]|uniref:DUF2339 domain-containing protein n=1 Tax=Methylobacterium haplocladii TaxID=1176176 RepID=A0A512IM46_9HYPH|nr:DUF2339 domain-containing protein [Methylobacterium haplocladii]GEO98718.1 hypothetical protein MHA02_11060 [Methylobacterium haplocladii]GJD85805.1 hypothetical protein HPGCJGGD_3698 [Methylobacterium haplocladii]GLS57632.1 hypothetical protein GCM10007887_02880 [Methylobacterium haplocladii]
MDELVFYAGLAIAALAILVSGPVAIALTIAQRGRIAVLESRLAAFERMPPAAAPTLEAPASRRQPEPARENLRPAPTVPPIPKSRPDPVAKPPRPSFEERFGTRWTVWVGGIALAFGAALLVRYSVEAGYFGPALRMASGFALALGFLAVGETLRRRLRGTLPVPATWPDIPAMVTAAGTVALFGAIYAAYALYGFIGPELAFVALGATGLAAMVLALLHGPALAGIGLIGALATPLLVGKGGGSAWPLTLYLPVVAASAYGFAWFKGWRALAVAGGIGAGAWSLLLGLSAGDASTAAAALIHVVLQAALAGLTFALPHHATTAEHARPDRATTAVLFAAALTMLAVLGLTVQTGYGAVWILTALAAVVIPAAAGFLVMPAAAGLVVAGLASSAVIILWPPEPGLHWDSLLIRLDTTDPGVLLALAGLSAVGIAAMGGLRLIGGGRLPLATALIYAAGAALAPLAALSFAYLRLAQASVSPSFALAAGVLALGMTGLAAAFRAQRERTPADALTIGFGVFAAAAVAALALGMVFAVSGGSLTVAMALAALGTGAIARRLDIPALRWCVAGLGVVVAGRLAWDPMVVGGELGQMPVLNWLLVGYGVPALAFGLASRLIRLPGTKPDAPPLIAEALSFLLAAFLVFFEIRHALHGGDIFAEDSGVLEQGLMALSALGFAAVLVRLDGVHHSAVIRIASLAFGVIAFAQSLLALVFAVNPLLTDEAVGGGILFNEIVIAYGLPALVALALARTAQATRPRWYVLAAGGVGMILGFLALTLTIRHGFQGAQMGLDRETSQPEWYAYSAGWLAFGLALLGYGLLRHSLTARLASAALVALSTLKVFLVDLAGLDGPLRALSFLGLGAVLIGIGLVYQRFVFAPARAT